MSNAYEMEASEENEGRPVMRNSAFLKRVR